MAQSIIEILAREHRHIADLFNDVRNASGEQRGEIFNSLKDNLIEHSRAEERVLYTQLEALGDLQKMAEDAREDHSVVDRILMEMGAKDVDHDEWIALLNNLEDNVLNHVKFEEEQIFDGLRQYFLNDELRVMGEEFLRVEERVKQLQTFKGIFRGLTKTVQDTVSMYFSR